MLEYSEFIVEAMRYVDGKIDSLNTESVDRNKLHFKIHIQIVSKVKQLVKLKRSDAYRAVDKIFRKQLLEELLKHL